MRLALISLSLLILSGCGYKNDSLVYVPTKCNIEKPAKPALDDDFMPNNIKNLLIYTESLESALDFCIGK